MYMHSHRLAVQEVLAAAFDMLSDILQRLAQAAHHRTSQLSVFVLLHHFFSPARHAFFRFSATPCAGCAPLLLAGVSICTFVPVCTSLCTFVPVPRDFALLLRWKPMNRLAV